MKTGKTARIVLTALLLAGPAVPPVFARQKGEPIQLSDILPTLPSRPDGFGFVPLAVTAALIVAAIVISLLLKNLKRGGVSRKARKKKLMLRQIVKWRKQGLSQDGIRECFIKEGTDSFEVDKLLGSYENMLKSGGHPFDSVTGPFMENKALRKWRRKLRRKILLRKIRKQALLRKSQEEIQKNLIQEGWQQKHVLDALHQYKTENKGNTKTE